MSSGQGDHVATLLHLAHTRLREWDVPLPLMAAYDTLDGEPVLTSDPRYSGYAMWAGRMNIRYLNEILASLRNGPVKPLAEDERLAIVSAVELALMENAELSIGLALAFDRTLGSHSEQLYCLHQYSSVQLLVSATDGSRLYFYHHFSGLGIARSEPTHMLPAID
jgi:hypothetical protein